MILDAGFLISVDRGEDSAQAVLTNRRLQPSLHTTHPVLAQVWRDGARQARLAAFVKTLTVHPFDNGPAVGHLLARSETSDVVDAHLVAVAMRLKHDVLTGDSEDITAVCTHLGREAPRVHQWP